MTEDIRAKLDKLEAVIYKCDPNKNLTCAKTSCQKECFYTTNKNCSADGKEYTAKDIFEEELKREIENG